MTGPVVVLLPELRYLPALMAPERARSALAARLADRARRGQLRFDAAARAHSCAELARHVARDSRDTDEVCVVGRVWDERAAELLAEALLEHGRAARPALTDAELECALGLTWPDLPPAETELALPVNAPSARQLDQLVLAAQSIRRAHGDDALRLLPQPAAAADARVAGSPWALRFGWNRPGWPAAVAELVERACPSLALPLDIALGHLAQATAPREELWGGNGIAERNAELLANVVAPEDGERAG